MKIVFFGSSQFAVPSVERLLGSQHVVSAIVTQPDRKKGRRLEMHATPVKKIAISKGVVLYQPENLSDISLLDKLKTLSADLFIVVSFGGILSREVLEIPAYYAINLHPSLLPKYRGAAPVNWAIINGDKETGLTVIRMNEKMDAGDIILKRRVPIENEDTSETLNQKLADLGAILLLDVIRFIEEDKAAFKKQNDKKATFAPRLKKEDGLIDWGKTAQEIHNKVRGTVPWPGAYTYFDGKKINICKTAVLDGMGSPGEIVACGDELLVGAKKNLLKIEEIQMEGKKRMPASQFLRGFREMEKGKRFGV